MRDAFVDTLTELAGEDERVCALTGDLGLDLFDAFQLRAPGRFVNVGIAEQTLVGVAAGLALAGKVPFAYSIIPFVTSRPHDQIRVDVAMTGAPVKIVGVGAGYAYGSAGPTHHAIEDLALMRAVPGMTVLTPADPREAAAATRAALATPGPVYLRLGKNGEAAVVPPDVPYEPGVARWISRGGDVTLASIGTALPIAIEAAGQLGERGVRAGVLHFPSLRPFDTLAVLDALAAAPAVVTVEEHNRDGGFGSAVAEAMAESGLPGRLARVGMPDRHCGQVGSREYLMAHVGADAAGVRAAATALLERTRMRRAA
ncbi:MAG TPA: transketolase C-terminal domain-containing protein [Gaiellales bacterium]